MLMIFKAYGYRDQSILQALLLNQDYIIKLVIQSKLNFQLPRQYSFPNGKHLDFYELLYQRTIFNNMKSQQQIPEKSQIKQVKEQQKFDGLTKVQLWAYGMGHFLNDLTAACWFNYLLFFLKTVVKTSAASTALLAGQVCDGIATPIIGYLSDKGQSKYGKRTPWYVLGLLIILFTFIPIFCSFKSEVILHQYIYYSIFPGLFNIGWACLQISHMSLVPSLTCSRKRRDKLNNYRNSFSFLANFVVLTLGLIIFFFMNDKEYQYKIIAEIVIVIGTFTSLFFLWNIKQHELSKICEQKKKQFKLGLKKPSISSLSDENPVQSERKIRKNMTESTIDDNGKTIQDVVVNQQKKTDVSIGYWLVKPKFYLFGICYMCVRLNSNIFGTFLPFYLINVLKISKDSAKDTTVPFSVALVPLIIYFSSSLISLKLTFLYTKFGRAKTLIIGTILEIFSLTMLYFLSEQNKQMIYLLSVLIGVSQSMILSTGINLISDVIGSKGESGAFVFGVYSFLDKISAGLIIFFMANLPCFSEGKQINAEDQMYIKGAVIFIPIITVALSASITILYNVSEYMNSDKLSESRMQNQQFVHSVTLHN